MRKNRHSVVDAFVSARAAMEGTFYLDSDVELLEHRLRTEPSFLNVTYERSSDNFHSVTVFRCAAGFG